MRKEMFLKISALALFSVVAVLTTLPESSADEPPANPNVTRVSASAKFHVGNYTVNMLGVNYIHYENENFYLGGSFHTGQISGSTAGSYSEGGLLGGIQLFTKSWISLVCFALVGSGGGFTASANSGASFLVEPTVGLEFAAGKRIRAIIFAGYAWLPSATTYSSFSTGVRIDFLSN